MSQNEPSCLSAQALVSLFKSCLYLDSELGPDGRPLPEGPAPVIVEGITATFGLHPERLVSHKDEVRQMLEELDPRFFPGDEGGGFTFLWASFRKDDTQWGEQRDAELLLSLGMALGFVTYLAPREAWALLPGGMPYYLIDTSPKETP